MKIKAYHKSLEQLHVGTQAPRAYFIPYTAAEGARKGLRDASAQFTNLSGQWDFKFYESYEDVSEALCEKGLDNVLAELYRPGL